MAIDSQPTSPVIYSADAGVATLTFNRPDKLNALTPDMLGEFFDYVDQAA
jgi:1,4-dihydroxy-2-naphthoyl-CoA synthase